MQYNYQTQGLLDKGVNFATIYPEKQGVVKEMTGFDFDLATIVNFLQKETDNFTIVLPLALEIDKNIVSIYNKYQVSQGKKAEPVPAPPKVEPIPTPEPPKDERPSVAVLTSRLKLIKKMYEKNPSVVLKGRIKIVEKMLTQPEKFCCGGSTYAISDALSTGGKTSYDKIRPGVSFTISDMKGYLNDKFSDSFSFKVFPLKKGTNSTPDLDAAIVKDRVLKGLDDKDIDGKLHFPQYKRSHEINYQINQGGENTYFDFLLEDGKSNGYVGTFGFKDEGDTGPEWITGFLVFLQEQYGLPFQTEHNVYSTGGYLGKTPEQVWEEWNNGQRLHFLIDHNDRKQYTPQTQEDLSKKAYNFIPAYYKSELEKHIAMGQYSSGGELKTELKRLNDELAITERGTPERMSILGQINMLQHKHPELRKMAGGGKANLQDYYKDKQSGGVFTEQEMLDAVDDGDQLDSFYLIGQFKSKEEAESKLAGGGKAGEIKACRYHFGEYREEEIITKSELAQMIVLGDELAGFDIRQEDEGKQFLAYEDDIDGGDDDDGYAVKNAYAVSVEDTKGLPQFSKGGKITYKVGKTTRGKSSHYSLDAYENGELKRSVAYDTKKEAEDAKKDILNNPYSNEPFADLYGKKLMKKIRKSAKIYNYKGLEVSIRPASKTSKKYIVWDIKTDQIFANEKFDSKKDAEDFVNENKMVLINK